MAHRSSGSDESAEQPLPALWRGDVPGPLQHVCSKNGLIAAIGGLHPASVLVLEGCSSLRTKNHLVDAKLETQADLRVAEFTSNGTSLVAGGVDGMIRCWNLDTGQLLSSCTFLPHTRPGQSEAPAATAISFLTCSPVTNMVAAASGRCICIFGAAGEHLHSVPQADWPIAGLAWLDDQRLVAASGKQLLVWIVGRDECRQARAHTSLLQADIGGLSCSPSGEHLAAECLNSTAQVWSTSLLGSTTPSRPLVFGDQGDVMVTSLTWHSSSRYLAYACGGTVSIWDVDKAGAQPVFCLDTRSMSASAAFQSCGSQLAIARDTGYILFYSVRAVSSKLDIRRVGFTQLPTVEHDAPSHAVRLIWHPSGLLAAGESGELVCFDAAGLETSSSSRPHQLDSTQRFDHLSSTSTVSKGVAPASSMLANDVTDKLRELVLSQRDSASRQHSGREALHSRQHPTSDTGQQQQQATGTGRRTASGSSPRTGGSGVRSAGAVGQEAEQPGVGRGSSTYEHLGKHNSFAHASAAFGGDRADGRHADVIGWVSRGDNHSHDEASDDGRSDGADEQTSPCESHGRGSECAPSLHRLHQQIPEGQVPPPGWGMMPMPHWPMPYMPYGQVPGVPGMPYMMGPSGGLGNMPMPYPYMPVMPNGAGGAPPGYAFPNAAPGMPNGMVAPPGVAPQMPMYMNMYPPPAPWAGGPSAAYAPPQQWPMPFPMYPNDQAALARLASSVSNPEFVMKPPSHKPRKQRGGAATGDSRPPANSNQQAAGHIKSAPHTPAVRTGNTSNNNSNVNKTSHDSGSAQHDNNGIRRDSSETASTSGTSGTFGILPGHNRGCASVGGSSSVRPASSGGASGEERMRHLATLYIGNLAPTVEENVLYATFIQFGQITNAQIIRHPGNGISKGYGFVSFKHPPSATMAVHHMNGVNLMGTFQGRAIKVSRYTKANFKDVNKFSMVWPPHPMLLQTPKILEG